VRADAEGKSAHLLLDILDLFAPSLFPYGIVGALAASYYGIPRFTSDADITVWLAGTGKTGRDLKDKIAACGYDADLRFGDIEDPIAGAIIVRDTYGNQVDLLMGVRGMDPEASVRCLTTTLLGSTVRMIGVEDLIAMKLGAGGVQDLEDVRGILQVSKERVDIELTRKLTRKYGKSVRETLDKLLSSDSSL